MVPAMSEYFKLHDANGRLHHGDPSRDGIEARRASLIAEHERRANLVRIGFHAMLQHAGPPRQRMAVIRSHRNHLSILKEQIAYWQSAPIQETTI